MFPLSFFNYLEIAALVTSVGMYSKIRTTILRWFVPFLFFIVLVELTGRYVRRVLHAPNAWIYNMSTILEFLFYAFLFYHAYSRKSFKHWVCMFALIYPAIALINILFIQGFYYFHSYTMSVGSFFMILFSCLYFYELLLDTQERHLLRTPMFWITSGILFFYLGDFLYNTFFVFIENNQLDFTRKLFKAINNNLIIVLYACFIVGLVCQKTPNK